MYEVNTTELQTAKVMRPISGNAAKKAWFMNGDDQSIVLCDFTSVETLNTYVFTASRTWYNFSIIAVSDDNERAVVECYDTFDAYNSGDAKYRILSLDEYGTPVVRLFSEFPQNNDISIKLKIGRVNNNYVYALALNNVLYIANDDDVTFEQFDTYEEFSGYIDATLANSLTIGFTKKNGFLYYGAYNKLTYYDNLDASTKKEVMGVETTGFNWKDYQNMAYGLRPTSGSGHISDIPNELIIYPNFPDTTGSYPLCYVSSSFFDRYGYGDYSQKEYLIDVPNGTFSATESKLLAYEPYNSIKQRHVVSKPSTDGVTINKQRQKLLQALLFSRFDNNYWFAKDNFVFISKHNDPTYFPITEYDDLGDANSPITGFNVANDTTLLAYKTDRVYLIQPFTSSLDAREYTVTESKNTVGNTAVGAPIVTTLTEIPLQINYDGIYGLSQLQNVSAVERIADLMSEPINDRWLNEDDVVIKKAMTLNRLYWTYIILPYESVTKIYLLDNRTNSWYYWELPIKLLEAFAKDNRAEFVDTDGNIYYLTTTDIKNVGFDTQLVTEYYDDGKKLINWFWQSQILPMGTMNYAKRLVNTTFILTDTDTQDGYGLKYNFKVFRKLASSTPEKEINDELNLVRSTTKKTNISKFGFIQLKISNITEKSQGTEAEKAYRNNKLRLVGLGLKYVLLEGLIR